MSLSLDVDFCIDNSWKMKFDIWDPWIKLPDTNTITSEIPVDYYQKSNTNFQGNL